mgnify:CR=1 FL=1
MKAIKRESHKYFSLVLLGVFFSLYCFYYFYSNPRKITLLIGTVSVIYSVLTYYLFCIKSDFRYKMPFIFGSLALALIFFTVFFPPFGVPDEVYHYLSSYWLLDCFKGRASFAGGEFPIRSIDHDLIDLFGESSKNIGNHSFSSLTSCVSLWANGSVDKIVGGYEFTIGNCNFICKLPSMIGLAAGIAFNFGAVPTFYLGRLFSAAAFFILVVVSYKLTPYFKHIILFIAFLPMTLHLASSYSYDAGIIGLSLLVFSLLMRAFACGEREISYREVFGFAILAFFFAPCKSIYCTVIFLFIFIPNTKFSDRRTAIISKVLILLLPFVSIGIFSLSSIASFASASASFDVRGAEVGHFYSMAGILSHPFTSFVMLMRTLINGLDYYWETMFGYELGWLQTNLAMPIYLMVVYLFLAFFCCIKDENDVPGLNLPIRCCFIATSLISAFGAILSMWLCCTFDTENVVMGVQGRYFLPIVPFVLSALRFPSIEFKGSFIHKLFQVEVLTGILYIVRLVSIATL